MEKREFDPRGRHQESHFSIEKIDGIELEHWVFLGNPDRPTRSTFVILGVNVVHIL